MPGGTTGHRFGAQVGSRRWRTLPQRPKAHPDDQASCQAVQHKRNTITTLGRRRLIIKASGLLSEYIINNQKEIL